MCILYMRGDCNHWILQSPIALAVWHCKKHPLWHILYMSIIYILAAQNSKYSASLNSKQIYIYTWSVIFKIIQTLVIIYKDQIQWDEMQMSSTTCIYMYNTSQSIILYIRQKYIIVFLPKIACALLCMHVPIINI